MTVKTKDDDGRNRTWSTSGVPSLDDKLTAGNASSPLTRTVRMLMSLCSDRWLYYTAEALGPGYHNITRGYETRVLGVSAFPSPEARRRRQQPSVSPHATVIRNVQAGAELLN